MPVDCFPPSSVPVPVPVPPHRLPPGTHRPPCVATLAGIEADPDFPRGDYAADVLYGRQLLSGADIRGKAAGFAWYWKQRRRIFAVARRHGVHVVALPPAGKLAWHAPKNPN